MYIEGLQRCRPFLLGANKILLENSATGMRPCRCLGCFPHRRPASACPKVVCRR